MEKKDRLIIGGILLILILCMLSFGFYKVFSTKNPAIISNLEVSFSDSGKTIVNEDFSLKEEYIQPYTFRIANKNQFDTKYKVVLTDNSKSKDSISRDKLQYRLVLNNKVIATGKLSEIKNDIIDSRVITKGTTNRYEFKVWLLEDDDYENTVYTYSIKVVSIL